MSFSLVDILVKSSLVISLAAIAAGFLQRRSSAASRHLIWTLAVVGLLVLPFASMGLPSLDIPIAWQLPSISVVQPSTVPGAAPASPEKSLSTERPVEHAAATSPVPWIALLPVVYFAGVVFLLGRVVVEHWRTRRLLSRTTAVDDPGWRRLLTECCVKLAIRKPVRLARSREASMPMACGIRTPAIVIPSVADTWSDERRAAVILHELAHVGRLDCFTQTLAAIAAALYWPHPGIWWVVRQLRVERELACDDCVLAAGAEPREYAGHLLEIAHSLGGYHAPALAVTMARPRQLEGRMMAMLDATRNRRSPAAGRRLAALVTTVALAAPLGAATVVAVPGTRPQTNVQAASGQATSSTPLSGGTWQIRLADDRRQAHLTISVSANSSHGTTIPLNSIEGLAQILTGPGGPAHYTLKRDAGTFEFEGVIRSGAGGGTFSFTPNATFADELSRRGIGKPTPLELGTLAWSDIGFAFIDELNALKYERPTLQQLVNGARHGVTRSYVKEMADLGYRIGTIDALVRLRDHGVDPAFIRDMRALGYAASLDQLVDARNHGIDPAYVRDMRAAGFARLTHEDLVNARNHGVDPGFINEMASAGYPRLSLADLVGLRNHGVNAKTVEQLKKRGVDHPTIDRLIELQSRGASADGALTGPRLQASGSLMASVHRIMRDLSAEARRWADRWLD